MVTLAITIIYKGFFVFGREQWKIINNSLRWWHETIIYSFGMGRISCNSSDGCVDIWQIPAVVNNIFTVLTGRKKSIFTYIPTFMPGLGSECKHLTSKCRMCFDDTASYEMVYSPTAMDTTLKWHARMDQRHFTPKC